MLAPWPLADAAWGRLSKKEIHQATHVSTRTLRAQTFPERFFDNLSRFSYLRFYPKFDIFGGVLMILVVFSDSLALSASIPLFVVQEYPLGVDF